MSFSQCEGFIFDLDGVFWLGSKPIPDVGEAVNAIRAQGRRVRFLTNNASQHRKEQCAKLNRFGTEADPAEVITAGSATAETIQKKFGSQKVFVMGTDGLKEEMEDAGHSVVEDGAECVVVGFDKTFNYEKLQSAFRNIHYHKARFIACNENSLYPTESGLSPGNGASVAALAFAAGKQPELVVGKPHRSIFDIALEKIDLPAESCAMVADLLELDIKGAKALGMQTIFVLSGIDSEEDIQKTGITPDHILPSAANLKF